MHRSAAALALVALTACTGLQDPAVVYRQAVRQLRFTLDRVQPTLELRLPVDRSGLRLNLLLGVENPSTTRIPVVAIQGTIWMEIHGQSFRIGEARATPRTALEPGGKGQIAMDLFFGIQDLNKAWEPVRSALRAGTVTWRFEGQASIDVLGLTFHAPIVSTHQTGGGR